MTADQALPLSAEDERNRSVVYRTGTLTVADYDEAIRDLQSAREDLLDKAARRAITCCYVCTDSGHTAQQCHHNPLVLARERAAALRIWQCWHCGYEARTTAEAEEHFGLRECDQPACINSLTAERDEAVADRDAWANAIVKVVEANPGFDWRDWPDGITAEEAANYFDEDMREAWKMVEKAQASAAAAIAERDTLKARVEGLEAALERIVQRNQEQHFISGGEHDLNAQWVTRDGQCAAIARAALQAAQEPKS